MKQSDSFQKQNKSSGNMNNKDNYFSALKTEDYSGTFPETENWIYKTNIQLEKGRKERKLKKMKNYFLANKLRMAYPVVLLAVLIAACSMPVTQTESAGSMMSWTVAKDNTDAQNKINLLPWLKNASVTSNENVNNGKAEMLYTAVLQNTTEEQMNSYRKELEAVGGITSLKITPMNYDVKRPLYSAALHNFFSININATGMSDEQVQNEIQQKLNEQGVDIKVKVRTDENGKRDLMMEMNHDIKSQGEPKSFELNVEDKNGQEKIKLMQKKADPEKFKGKTDEEIRKMVRDETGNKDLKDNEIVIIRSGENVGVKVQVERTDKK